ncbi:hypothetical protein Tco_1453706 [Tanacetum coccineum]
MMDADYQMAQQLQAEEQKQLSIEAKSKLFLEQEVAKKQKINDAKVDDDQEEARMKELLNIVPDEEEVAIDAIPLATKPPCIKFDREDLETLLKLVKAKHGSTRPEEGYDRVLWGDLMTMFEPNVEIPVWRTLQDESVDIEAI